MASPFPYSLFLGARTCTIFYRQRGHPRSGFQRWFYWNCTSLWTRVSNTGRRRSARAFKADPSSYRFCVEAIVSSRDRNRYFLYYVWDVKNTSFFSRILFGDTHPTWIVNDSLGKERLIGEFQNFIGVLGAIRSVPSDKYSRMTRTSSPLDDLV